MRAALERGVLAGGALLAAGGRALDAVEAAARALEDEPRFNAGVGSVLTAAGEVEMDAAIMCGRTHDAGAVAAVGGVRNPVALARAVLDRSAHVLLAGAGAERFAAEHGVERVPRDFHAVARERPAAEDEHGTVGAVALDARGDLAAATSTGGVRGQAGGRIGDTPLIGAGTWADNASCAVSASGDGERFVQAVAAHEVAALVRHRGMGLADALDTVLAGVARLGGTGGLIALGPGGEVATAFTTEFFHRAWRIGDGPVVTAVAERNP